MRMLGCVMQSGKVYGNILDISRVAFAGAYPPQKLKQSCRTEPDGCVDDAQGRGQTAQ
jgi:hypothetical protein